ncbi:MAG: tRNA uridine-5-carboxymethylaminomethyl(34) synthesis GTPase MnmE [candidate division Zixibacteria bacterium]|nr:tRNA uridine-5-carboxymethylaminomethyl(34) synthesis GTPase MnmE [candidate division Zixibacteria bacterium]
MRDFSMNDTITAIATPPGEGALAIVRLSGARAVEVVHKLWHGKSTLVKLKGGNARYGRLYSTSGEFLDEVVAVVMRSPNSYTGEDTVEIICHGGYLSSRKILGEFIKLGIREAERGEFTLRAFLNNRIDLTRAEAVMDMVSARADKAYNAALEQLSGKLYDRVNAGIDELKELLSLTELGIDFAEEDIVLSPDEEIKNRVRELSSNLENLSRGYHAGRILNEGFRVAITGKVNVGKSSLLNTILGSDRAIVTEIPGTTRDSISESVSINGMEVHFTDTAGFREGVESIEEEGIRRARDIISASDLTIVLFDPVTGFGDDDRIVLDTVGENEKIMVMNKKDLYKDSEWERLVNNPPREIEISISALTGENVDRLLNAVYERALASDDIINREILITNRRHYNCLRRAVEELENALSSSGGREILAENLRLALNHLGEITGEVTTEEILNSIFDNFCIGK